MGDVSEKTLLFEFTKFYLEDERLFTDQQVTLAPSSSGSSNAFCYSGVPTACCPRYFWYIDAITASGYTWLK
jgi:hypothetical protein